MELMTPKPTAQMTDEELIGSTAQIFDEAEELAAALLRGNGR